MASTGEEHGLFWNSENGDRTYDANSFEYWLKKFFTSGVFEGDLQVQATSGMTLKVGSGYANTDGKVKFWNAEFSIVLDAANSTYPRIDTIVITRDNVNRTITCEKVTGAYSVDVPQPTPPVRDSETWQLVIAQVYVPAGATGITQSNITDTRPDPNLCGYITGTVTEMDFSQFSSQFAAYYNEFVAGHEADFDTWEATQQAAYAAWYAEVVAQMQDDHEAFEEWFQNLQNQLDTDQLTHLQAQIDDLYSMAPAGSYITVTTEETTLYSMDVTITDGTHTITSEFNNEGVAEFKTLPYVGNFMISSTDGNDRAHTTVNIPYFGRYAYEIAFWNAYVNIDGGDALAGADVVVTNSEDVEVATVTLNNHGQGVFNAKEPDYYTFTAEYTGGVAIAELDVEEQMTYSLTMYAGWKTWVELGGLSPSSYETLEDVFDDEPAVRRLMTIHASADYLIAMATADITVLDDFVDNDTAMKWIGLRDYVCDGLTNIAGVEAMFMASDYWERYLKDHVPAMISNNAPYDLISATSQLREGYEAYKAFDGNDNSWWLSAQDPSSSTELVCRFLHPICVKKMDVLIAPSSVTSQAISFKVYGTNDGSWVELKNVSLTAEQTKQHVSVEIENNESYYYYKISNFSNYLYMSGTYGMLACVSLQYYGRELSTINPEMTSNTEPYYSLSGTDDGSNVLWKALDVDNTTFWNGTSAANANLVIDFGRTIRVKKVSIYPRYLNSHSFVKGFVISGSNDGIEWTDLYSGIHADAQVGEFYNIPLNTGYRYWRITKDGNNYFDSTIQICVLRFYGVDYSEREFATGSTMKYLYDHGVLLNGIEAILSENGYSSNSSFVAPIINSDGSATESTTGAQVSGYAYQMDGIENKDGSFSIVEGNKVIGTNSITSLLVAYASKVIGDPVARLDITLPQRNLPEKLDISSVNGGYVLAQLALSGTSCKLYEWWLE